MKKNKCVVELQGGFGNQLFQLNLANYLKKKDYEVSISTKIINEVAPNVTKREVLLPIEYFQLEKVNKIDYFKIQTAKKIKRRNIFSNLIDGKISEFKGYEVDFERINKQNYFLGYWKNIN